MIELFHHALRLHADPSRVVVRPFHLAWAGNGQGPSRTERIVREVLELNAAETRAELEIVLKDFEARHWQTRRVFMTRYDEIEDMLGLDGSEIGDEKRQLIGAYFCHEYSYAAAALMNPSVVPHPDQSGMPKRIAAHPDVAARGGRGPYLLGRLSRGHHHRKRRAEARAASRRSRPRPMRSTSTRRLPEGPITVYRHRDSTLSGTVIFPITGAQSNGLEDLRLVQFTHDDGSIEWIGTYTAYIGLDHPVGAAADARLPRVRSGADERRCRAQQGHGAVPAQDRRAIHDDRPPGRRESVPAQVRRSHALGRGREAAGARVFPWELVQIGNCGPPIELDEGWLLLTHGVGAMRKYSIGAVLLDKHDPSKVIGRTSEPILAAANQDREGYVPNVVYTCGAIRHGDKLFVPYGVADSSVAFAFIPIGALLEAM